MNVFKSQEKRKAENSPSDFFESATNSNFKKPY